MGVGGDAFRGRRCHPWTPLGCDRRLVVSAAEVEMLADRASVSWRIGEPRRWMEEIAVHVLCPDGGSCD